MKLNSRDRRTAITNDRGEFRFAGLAPERYVVAASPLNRPNAGVRDTYVRTYYPGTIESLRAVPVTVALGSEAPGLDFTIQTSVVVSVRGKVILDVPDVRFPYTASLQPTLLLHSFDPDPLNTQATRSVPQAVDRSNGQFEIRGVRPGRYELVVSIPGGPTRSAFDLARDCPPTPATATRRGCPRAPPRRVRESRRSKSARAHALRDLPTG